MVEPENVVAMAFVMLIVPNVIMLHMPSSTIHSARPSDNAAVDVNDFVAFWPVVTFSMTAWPTAVLEVLTVTVTTSLVDMARSEKSEELSGYHWYQAV